MNDRPSEDAPPLAATRRGPASGWLSRAKAAPVSEMGAPSPSRTLGQATNLKRVRLSAPEPAPSPPGPLLAAPPPPPKGSSDSPALPAQSLLATAGVLPEQAEALPWPSEEEMLAAWAVPATDSPSPEPSAGRAWVAVPVAPIMHQTEVLEPVDPPSSGDLRLVAIDSVSFLGPAPPSAHMDSPAPALLVDPPTEAVLPHLDLALYPPAPPVVSEEPVEYFPLSLEGDTTLRLAPEPMEEGSGLAGTTLLDPSAQTVASRVQPVRAGAACDSPAQAAASAKPATTPEPRPTGESPAAAERIHPAAPASPDPKAIPEPRQPAVGYAGLAAQLLEVFKEEAVEMLDILHASLETLERGPSASALIEARRTVHTMKGSARMCGLAAITELAHGCEDLIGPPNAGQDTLAPPLVALLFEAETALRASVSRPANGPGSDESVRALTTRLRGARLRPAPTPATPPPLRPVEPAPVSLNQRPALLRRPALTAVSHANNRLAIDLGKVENVVAKATEIIANRATSHALVEALSATVTELTHNVQRLQSIAMNLQYQVASQGLDSSAEDDPDGLGLETYGPIKQLLLQLQEAVSDQQALARETMDGVNSKRTLAALETRLDTELQASLMSMRLLPLSQLRVRLDQVVRSAAAATGHEVRWTMEGHDVALDKQVCDRLFEPLMHVLRNAVDHGIEPPEERRAQGKPSQGAIAVTAVVEGNQVVITVSDDGRGIDPEHVTAKAIERGIISASRAQALTTRERLELVFHPGFSTAEAVTELSGRGMGMEIVRESCIRMGGAATIGSRSQGGTVITLQVPLTLSIVHTLVVRDGGRLLAIPASQVTSVHLVNPAAISSHGSGQTVRIAQTQVPLYRLPSPAPPRSGSPKGQEQSVLLVSHRGKYAALMVDELVNEEDMIVKPLPLLLQGVDRLLGAVVLADGVPAPVLNLAPLLNSIAGANGTAPAVEEASAEQVVLVVDDSLTMRMALSQSLSHGGYTVVTARDGQEALEIIRARGLPDLITLDVEMPRMDGLETLYAIRHTPGGESLPIFMITSRTGQKHKRTAMQMGATQYFTKPYRDSEFMGAVQQATAARLLSTG
ncbi:MAG TPA: response regulator [Chloroflexota bacterium]|nr:response regulator [Chloroflexota bacterium]